MHKLMHVITLQNEANINLCREVLKELVTWLQKGSDTSRGKMLYNTHVSYLLCSLYLWRSVLGICFMCIKFCDLVQI